MCSPATSYPSLPHTLDGEPAPGQHKHSRERQPAEPDRARSKRRVSAIRT